MKNTIKIQFLLLLFFFSGSASASEVIKGSRLWLEVSEVQKIKVLKSKDNLFKTGDVILNALNCNYDETVCEKVDTAEARSSFANSPFKDDSAINSIKLLRDGRKYSIYKNRDGKIETKETIHLKSYIDSKFAKEFDCFAYNRIVKLKIDTIGRYLNLAADNESLRIDFRELKCNRFNIICEIKSETEDLGLIIITEQEEFLLKFNKSIQLLLGSSELKCIY
ncbi:hypothetical protein [Leptospira perolatii]|nr:hypothetical protein [Leptospira perolatii]